MRTAALKLRPPEGITRARCCTGLDEFGRAKLLLSRLSESRDECGSAGASPSLRPGCLNGQPRGSSSLPQICPNATVRLRAFGEVRLIFVTPLTLSAQADQFVEFGLQLFFAILPIGG